MTWRASRLHLLFSLSSRICLMSTSCNALTAPTAGTPSHSDHQKRMSPMVRSNKEIHPPDCSRSANSPSSRMKDSKASENRRGGVMSESQTMPTQFSKSGTRMTLTLRSRQGDSRNSHSPAAQHMRRMTPQMHSDTVVADSTATTPTMSLPRSSLEEVLAFDPTGHQQSPQPSQTWPPRATASVMFFWL